MAGVDLEPNRPTDRLSNVTFRRCAAVNNSGAGFQVFPGALNASSLPMGITFEDCRVSGVGFKPYVAIAVLCLQLNDAGRSGDTLPLIMIHARC